MTKAGSCAPASGGSAGAAGGLWPMACCAVVAVFTVAASGAPTRPAASAAAACCAVPASEGQGRQPVETQQGDQGREIGAGRIGGQGAQIDNQRIVVKKIRDIAVLAGQFGREGVQIGGLQAQCHQRKIRALDLERGRRVSCNGNGHGGWNARRKRARILPAGPAAPAGGAPSPALRPLPFSSIQGICFDPMVENWIFSLKNNNLKLKSSCASGVENGHRVATGRLRNGGLVNHLCTADPQLVVYSGWVTSRKSGSSG
jgi:hypothetical protein